MEVAPIFIALPVMLATYRRFPLTTLLYVLIFIHALVLIAGGRYTDARVPLGFWIEHALSLGVVMAISAWYELIEWWSELAMGQGTDEFLGTQGDPWDTQSDMFSAFIGAMTAMILLSWLHDSQMHRLKQGESV